MAPPSIPSFLNGLNTAETIIARLLSSAFCDVVTTDADGLAGMKMPAGTKHVVSRRWRQVFHFGSSVPGLTAEGFICLTPYRMSENNTYEVYTVVNRGEDKKPLWLRIGAAFSNQDGSMNIVLNALPMDGKLQVREGKNA